MADVWRVLTATYVALHLVVSAGSALREPDTPTYFRLDFIGGVRPWTVPLLYQLPESTLVTVQVVLAAAAWLWLAWTLAGTLRSAAVRVGAVAAVLALGLSPTVAVWNSSLLSESLAVTLTVASIAAVLRVLDDPTTARISVAVGLVVLWAFTKQIHLLLVPALAIGALVWCVVRRDRARAAVLVGALVLTAWSATFTLGGSEVTAQFNRLSVIADRVMVDAEMRDHFVSAGMPVSEELEAEVGAFRGSESALSDDDALLVWADEHFDPTYASWAVAHPAWAISEPMTSLMDNGWHHHLERGRYRLLPGVIGGGLIGVLLVVGLMLMGRAAISGGQRQAALVVALVGVAAALALPAWHLATQDIGRLMLPSVVLVSMAAILSAAWGVDGWLTRQTANELTDMKLRTSASRFSAPPEFWYAINS